MRKVKYWLGRRCSDVSRGLASQNIDATGIPTQLTSYPEGVTDLLTALILRGAEGDRFCGCRGQTQAAAILPTRDLSTNCGMSFQEFWSIYVLDRKSGVWYWIDFEDNHYGGYSREELERLLSEGKLLALIERPGLLGNELRWVVECGQVPVAT